MEEGGNKGEEPSSAGEKLVLKGLLKFLSEVARVRRVLCSFA
jgi:hypothetical protein